ncbi:hypothetical protein PYW07_004811 [Mythimna separata]|uniref:Uncharacterized protein n=1 Tax=Mythimna separata TaxID=271217 RepID=A0AAD7YZ09_MYTSE|nr:hypothetical protein PYW07_004811 [Mythimna separata]
MATKSVNFDTQSTLAQNLEDCSHWETVAKWLSCNGEVWGVGPTLVFASAAALFLYNELKNTVFMGGDQARVYMLEKTLISTMILGMLALMIHLWVCSMRFFQYYLDTIIKDSPGVLLEMTTAGLLGSKAEMLALGPLTRFLRQQQPQIHITVCWFLSLCYADYVRKNYCQRFNMPYLEQWQTELHDRAVRSVNSTVARVNSFVGCVQQRLRGFTSAEPVRVYECRPDCQTRPDAQRITETPASKKSSVMVCTTPTICGGSSSLLDFHTVPVISKSAKDLSVRLVNQTSETTVQAIEKLRSYVQATRCACQSTPVTSIANPVPDCSDAPP